MSLVKKGKRYSPATEFKKGSKINFGRRHSIEWREKVSKGWFKKGTPSRNKGIPLSEEQKRKISVALKGKTPWNKGIPMTQEQKDKLSKTLKGLHRSIKTEFKRGNLTGNKNPAKRLEIRKKISVAKLGVPHFNQRGIYHPRYKGIITTENERDRKSLEYKTWRRAIFLRDNWTCQRRKKRGVKIHAHHIFNFSRFNTLRTSIDNGVTLCNNCHKSFHTIYGVKNITREKLENFLHTL